jgi:hypothetical protein
MYVKATNEIVEIYPYSIGKLRKDNPNTSFPKNPSAEMLANWNVYPVTVAQEPSIDNTQKAYQNSEPSFIDDSWILGWTVVEKTQEEITEENNRKAESIRSERNTFLLLSDWTQLNDAPLNDTEKTAWATYRQELRDITDQAGFPTNITWPTEP